MATESLRFNKYLSFFLILSFSTSQLQVQAQDTTTTPTPTPTPTPTKKKNHVSALFAFGDSTIDSGNNDFIPTAFRCDFPPYGRDFVTHEATGRCSNGKLVTDFLASYLGLKEELPAYLDWSLGIEELTTGVSFGSGGTGLDPLTPQIDRVIPIPQQLNYFKDYFNRLDQMVGVNAREDIIKRAVFFISAGSNDFVAYAILPIRRQSFSIDGYQGFILQNLQALLQGLVDLGASRFLVVGLPPVGCLPFVITLTARDGIHERECIDSHNAIADVYNRKLQVLLQDYAQLMHVQILYADAYTPLISAIQTPDKYGFEDSKKGCCGTGLIEAAILCNPKSLVCSNVSAYVFWDSIHPTEKMYFLIFQYFRTIIDQVLKSY